VFPFGQVVVLERNSLPDFVGHPIFGDAIKIRGSFLNPLLILVSMFAYSFCLQFVLFSLFFPFLVSPRRAVNPAEGSPFKRDCKSQFCFCSSSFFSLFDRLCPFSLSGCAWTDKSFPSKNFAQFLRTHPVLTPPLFILFWLSTLILPTAKIPRPGYLSSNRSPDRRTSVVLYPSPFWFFFCRDPPSIVSLSAHFLFHSSVNITHTR